MRKLYFKASWLIGLVASAAFIVPSANASHKWSNYHWARTSQANTAAAADFTLYVVNHLASNWSPFLIGSETGAVTQWNSPNSANNAGLPPNNNNSTVYVSSGTASAVGDCNAIAGKTVVCNKAFGYRGWLGLAQIWTSGSHITQGVAKMNDSYFNLSTYNNQYEKLHVMCQEIAHTFGLGHQDTSGATIHTCMDYYSNTGVQIDPTKFDPTTSTWPNTHDFGMLECIYTNYTDTYFDQNTNTNIKCPGHLDLNSTVATASALTAAVPSEIPDMNGWGRLVSQTRDGRHSNYERVFPNGVRVLTDVLWTAEIANACRTCDHRAQRAP